MPIDLTSLRSISGVEGSFLYDASGVLLGRDLPALYADDFLISLQPSFQVAFSTADQYIGIFDDLWLSYRERALYIRRLQDLMLCVIAMPSCNPDGLRIGSNILIMQALRLLTQPPTTATAAIPPASAGARSAGVFAPSRKPAPLRPPPPPSRPRPPSKGNDIWG